MDTYRSGDTNFEKLVQNKQTKKTRTKLTAAANFGYDNYRLQTITKKPNFKEVTHHIFPLKGSSYKRIKITCSHFRISPTDSKVRTTLYSVINGAMGKYCLVAFT